MTDIQASASGLPPYPVQPVLDVAESARATWRVFKSHPWRLIALLLLFPVLIALPFSIVQAVVGAVAADNRALVISVAVVGFIVQLGGQFSSAFYGAPAGSWKVKASRSATR